MPPPEQVVLLDDEGTPVGVADKATVHRERTPRHLGFSCYGFDRTGRVLVTQRSRLKGTFQLVWSNTCCGHPAPGEELEDAVRRRLLYELGIRALDVELVLPEFSYRARHAGVEENELCPVLVCRIAESPLARPDEVEAWQWRSWEHLVREAASPDSVLSPWARLQIPLLAAARAGSPIR